MKLPQNTGKFQFNSGDEVDNVIQSHTRKNRSDHMDLRLGTPNAGLYSWALVNGKLPEVGQRVLAVETPVHDFKSNINPKRPGTNVLNTGKARIVKAGPGKVSFELNYGEKPARYTLIQSKKNIKDWIMIRSKGGDKVLGKVQL